MEAETKLVVKKILDQDGRKTQFGNNLPGRDWWQRFLKRHPQLTERQGEALGKERAQLWHEKVEAWYDEFETYMKTSQDLDGKGVRFRYYPLEGAPADWFMGRSGNGWIDSEVFYEWIANHFLPEVKKHGVKFPVVLLVDGHKPVFRSLEGHWTKEVKEFTLQSDGQTVTKVNFAGVFAKAWKKSTIKETAMNGFRSAGIFPFNKNAYKSKILQGEQNTNTEDCVVAEVQQQKSCPPAATAGLQAFESCISEEKKWLFEKRFAEKYDIQTDELYNVWKKLKVGSTTVEEGDQQRPEETPKLNEQLPKAISGEKFRKYLKDKQQEREEEETRKQKNREEREAKKKEK
ncbi:hypothetical protein HOLleu_10826 [Holothuria leucospilota]|uniref:Uncharacterized protein n=1 Tax=Holothuria leucospilota TaxID=206669 RepID=A0A9Q1CFC5_HOLLE|nr:hypothetical protein HOLleu_10826 [Holothuria leucospilota]